MVAENITLISELSKITDPRLDRHKRHNLLDILVISIWLLFVVRDWDQIANTGIKIWMAENSSWTS